MKIYLIRHGRSQDVEAGISQRWDSGLSETAKQQIIALKTEFQKIPFNKIYHSPWSRAKQTAQLLFNDTKFPLEEIEYIYEYRKPKYLEGLSRSSAEERKMYDISLYHTSSQGKFVLCRQQALTVSKENS